MQGRKGKIVFFVIIIVMIILYAVSYCSRSKAENEHHYTSDDMFTPDPNGSIYDTYPTDEPFYPEPVDIDVTFQPITWGDPDSPNNLPYNNTQLKYDPFLIYIKNGNPVWKRLNGTITDITPPVTSSSLHSTAPSYSNSSSDTTDYSLMLKYVPSVSGLTQSTTEHMYSRAQLAYVFFQQLITSNSNYRVMKNDKIDITVFPKLKYLCEDPSLMDNSLVPLNATVWIAVDYYNINNSQDYFTVSYEPDQWDLRNDGNDSIHVVIEHDQSKFYYIGSWTLRIIFNQRWELYEFIDSVRDPVEEPMFYYSQLSDPSVQVQFFNQRPTSEIIGGYITNLFSGITSLFLPSQSDVADWIEAHTSDELESGNTLNVAADIFVDLADMFTGYQTAGRPVIEVPALSFQIASYGKVTPFEGYTWDLSANAPVDGSGRSLWYYVKLANSVVIASGFVGMTYRWFRKWYEVHFADGSGDE